MPEDLDPLERALLANIADLANTADLDGPHRDPDSSRGTLDSQLAVRLFDVQVSSRNIDHAARWLRTKGIGYYTIGSAGHESNAVVAAALRPTDPALLHYRSGGFYLARAAQVSDDRLAGVRDVLAGMLGLVEEPIAGGRHLSLIHI